MELSIHFLFPREASSLLIIWWHILESRCAQILSKVWSFTDFSTWRKTINSKSFWIPRVWTRTRIKYESFYSSKWHLGHVETRNRQSQRWNSWFCKMRWDNFIKSRTDIDTFWDSRNVLEFNCSLPRRNPERAAASSTPLFLPLPCTHHLSAQSVEER